MAEIDEVKAKVSKGLEYARWKLLERAPFIGEMLLRFQIVPTYDGRLSTAATDGSKIFFDCEFYSKLTDGERQFVLAHGTTSSSTSCVRGRATATFGTSRRTWKSTTCSRTRAWKF